MVKKFIAYDLALELYNQCEGLKAKHHVKDQLERAALSVALNLAEGSGKPTMPEKRRFYSIALGSLRETQTLLQIIKADDAIPVAHRLGGMIYRLVHPTVHG
ncbi:MAG: four helix bundle protein [Deltaproteobacteria bacterium]|nr:four helix bundle protein [Deltaproteobacteria bacterium]